MSGAETNVEVQARPPGDTVRGVRCASTDPAASTVEELRTLNLVQRSRPLDVERRYSQIAVVS